jgi:hypothetical protein
MTNFSGQIKYFSDDQIDKLNKLELVRYIGKIDPFIPLFTRRTTTKGFRAIAKRITKEKINNKFEAEMMVENSF